MSILKTAFQIATSASDAKLSILIFHRVLPEIDPLFPDDPDARRFDQMMGWINSWFNVIPLDVAVDALKRRNLPARAMAVTFDDGYSDNQTTALPILKRHGLSATFFITTGYLNGGCMWNDKVIESIRRSKVSTLELDCIKAFEGSRSNSLPIVSLSDKRNAIQFILGQIKYLSAAEREAISESISVQCRADLSDNLMMTAEQIIDIQRAGMLIGAHTVTHPILAKLGSVDVRKEISESKQFLETILEEEISLFAYPNGKPNLDFQIKDAAIVKELGFKAAVTTACGVAETDSDLMQLPRFTPWGKTEITFGARLIKNIVQNKKLKPSQILY
jgi:peptidoglycan/xylan/chitin deacetylase (PgdA/CDA1 family)